MNIFPAERSLLKHGKPLPFGAYEGLIEDAHTSYWDVEGPLLARRRRTQRKAWIFYGVCSADMFVGIAIADAGMVGTAFAYLAVPSENLYIEDKITLPMSFGQKFDPSLASDWKLGKFKIESRGNEMFLTADGRLKLEIRANIDHSKGMSFVCPSNGRPFNFTYKNLCIPTDCKAVYKGKEYKISGPVGGIDFTKGYPPRETSWNWLSLIGSLEDGTPVGVNLVDKFNGNMENVAWVGDKKILIGEVQFSMRAPFDKNTWSIKSRDGLVDLTFTPKGARSENINIVMMKSRFIQPYGSFEGSISVDGARQKVKGYGVVEDHYAVW